MMAAPLALYIHWPFCKAKCPYCDFNSHVREGVEQERWRDALLRELRWTAEQTGPRSLSSIFFGGGTPSLMPPETVAALIAEAQYLWPSDAVPEITLEANPTSVEAARFAELKGAGVNRISMGIQSLRPDALRFLGRQHSVAEALDAFALAQSLFARTSFDLIYALPEQTAEQWEAELHEALLHAGKHLSLYQLTIEPGTSFFHAHASGKLPMPGDDHAAMLYTRTQEMMEAAGLPAYEISNHSAPGEACRHNLTYWRYGDYAGIGPGAHGRLSDAGGMRHATVATRSPEKWLEQVEVQGHGRESSVALNRAEMAEECLLMGLRLGEGISLAIYEKIAGRPFACEHPSVQALIEDGFITVTPEVLRVLPEGRLLLNHLLLKLQQAQDGLPAGV